MIRRAAFLVLACAAPAMAADPAWPPPPETQARIETLRQKIGDASATAADRQAAREELVRLLMHPSAPATAQPPKPARAAIDPLPSVLKPASPGPPGLPGPPAITPVAPPADAPRPIVDPHGGVVVPAGKNVVDPRTGSLLLDVGNGYVDPATGRFIPKP
jgi:hypothetical protein